MGQYAKLIDISKCIGCRACEVACKEWNETGTDDPAEHPFGYQSHEDLTYKTWNVVKFFEADAVIDSREHMDLTRWMFRKHGCMHCTDAACIKACPVDALDRNNEMGYVRLDPVVCTGCGYCVDACPFDVPRLAPGAEFGFGKVSKCRLCSDRIQHDKQPACVQSCPANALEFGDRNDMIALGQSRIVDLRSRGYEKAYLYGEHELGGLNVLTVLPGRPEDFDLPSNPTVPDYLKTWKEVVKPLGALAIAGTALALGFGFLNGILHGSKSRKGRSGNDKARTGVGEEGRRSSRTDQAE